MRRRVIEALDYPRGLVQDCIEPDACPHAGRYDGFDGRCQLCEQAPECEWLKSNDEFVALQRKPNAELLDAFEFARDFVYALNEHWGHDAPRCRCEACAWLRMADGLLDDLLVTPGFGGEAPAPPRS